MTMCNTDELVQAAGHFIDPNHGKTLAAGRAKIVATQQDNGVVAVTLTLAYPLDEHQQARLAHNLAQYLVGHTAASAVEVKITFHIASHNAAATHQGLPGVKNMIAVASGKGGVGKSTTAVNLALALHSQGASVGLLDADIYGPSIPMMLAISEQPLSPDGKTIMPIVQYGIQTMSVGFLVDPTTPMIWRGPMVSNTLQQLLVDTCWDNLDYLIIDLPPGTGDIQLTLAQRIPLSGALVVTTPQDIALLDVRRAIEMFHKVKVPVLGVVENMSTHVCTQCGHEEAIFGEKGADQIAQEYQVDVLGRLPLVKSIRLATDEGKPTVVAAPDSEHTRSYQDIAVKLAARLALTTKDYQRKFPNIVVETNS